MLVISVQIYNNVCLIGRSQMAIIVSPATVAVCPADVIKGFPINAHFFISCFVLR